MNSIKSILKTVIILGVIMPSSCERKSQDSHQEQNTRVDGVHLRRGNALPFDGSSEFERVRKLLGTSAADSSDISKLTRHLESLGDKELVKMLASLDLVSSSSDRQMADHILRALSVKNPRLMLDTISNLPQGTKPVPVLGVCYTLMVEKDPETVLGWLSENGNSTSQHVMIAASCSLGSLSKVRPEETVKLLAEMGPQLKGYFLPLVMKAIVERDPDFAVGLAKKNFTGNDLGAAMVAIVSNSARIDANKTMAILRDVPPEFSGKCVAAALPSLLGVDGVDASSLISGLSPNDVRSALNQGGVVEKIARENPEQAVNLVSGVPFTEESKGLFVRLAMSLAEAGSDQALKFAGSLPDGKATGEIVSKVFETLARSDSGKALEQLASVGKGSQEEALRGIVRTVARADLDRALEIASGADPAFRQNVFREAAKSVVDTDRQQAVKLLENQRMTSVLGMDFRSEMLDHTVRGWAKSDLVEARAWVEKLPATDLPMGVQGLMNPWMKSDPVAASEWLSALPPGAARDAGARVVIEQVKNTDPEMAEQWRKSLSQPAGGQK